MSLLDILGRKKALFVDDIIKQEKRLTEMVSGSRFLVLGGAGTIGQAVTKEIFKRHPKSLHVVDLSENNLVELVRDLRSSMGYISGDFKTFTLDIGSIEFAALMNSGVHYDYVLNLSALKHVRNEKDPFTLMRMVQSNIFNPIYSHRQAAVIGAKKYFCVSTDKAANPVNMMGASKRIMELFLMRESEQLDVSMARFANVAFSDGSLLHGFDMRLKKSQPIAAPNDIQRYFVTEEESGQLCLLSCLLGENLDVFFPKVSDELQLQNLSEIAIRYLESKGLEPLLCENEDEARAVMSSLPTGKWPCLFQASDTSGEKEYEEFFTETETLDLKTFKQVGVIKQKSLFNAMILDDFENKIAELRKQKSWNKLDILTAFQKVLPEFSHIEKQRSLEDKM